MVSFGKRTKTSFFFKSNVPSGVSSLPAAFQNQMQRIVIFAHHTFADVGMFAPIRRFEYGEIFIYPRNDKIINVFCGKTFHGLIIPNGEKFVNGVCTKKHSECNKIVKYRNLQI